MAGGLVLPALIRFPGDEPDRVCDTLRAPTQTGAPIVLIEDYRDWVIDRVAIGEGEFNGDYYVREIWVKPKPPHAGA
jgi:hypothetical protein